ncbi:MAG TPA: MCE family protein [Candidatus Coprenecus stercoravium]|uniref:MCE family protein n=1 Tax=Candidatus Coprenecus stercoravium TaxID=2840735 RepID=A0A9D2KAM3_9BACT|nr:MCE family protein [Candidatus Coprenecus stercoravium]
MRKEVKIGIFAVIIIAAALFMIEFLKGKDLFHKNNTYYIIYPSVDGISVSTVVTVGGFQAGTVTDLKYNRSTMDYTVETSISRDFDIPRDSYMEIYSSDILGTKKIRVVKGGAAVMASSGDTLRGNTVDDMTASVISALKPALNRLDTLLGGLNRTITSVNSILDNGGRQDISQAVERINRSAGELCAVTGMLRSKSPDISGIIDNLSSISESLDSAAKPLSGTLRNTEAITASLMEAGIGETADSLRSLVIKLQNTDGSIGKLINDDTLYNTLTSLANDLDSLIKGIKEDPKKYIKISIF